MQKFVRSKTPLKEVKARGTRTNISIRDGTRSIREKVSRLLVNYEAAKKTVLSEKRLLIESKQKVEDIGQAQRILQEIAAEIQNKVHSRIANLVTKCLLAVFERDISFQIKFSKKRGKTEANLLFIENDVELDPLDSEGGGMLDVAAFGLRLAALMLHKPPLRRLIIADEPMKFLSPENRAKVGVLIEQLAEELDMQFILVTHDSELEIGKVIKL